MEYLLITTIITVKNTMKKMVNTVATLNNSNVLDVAWWMELVQFLMTNVKDVNMFVMIDLFVDIKYYNCLNVF